MEFVIFNCDQTITSVKSWPEDACNYMYHFNDRIFFQGKIGLLQIQWGFMDTCRFPEVVGAIDCIHAFINAEIKKDFFKPKNLHTIKCDHQPIILLDQGMETS